MNPLDQTLYSATRCAHGLSANAISLILTPRHNYTGRVGTLDVLLERATTLFPGRGALRRLYRASDGHRILDISDVTDGEGYVVAKHSESFKPVPYATATLRHQVKSYT